jgi:redox-sensing transcriptional repressor
MEDTTMARRAIPDIVVGRLPVYLRALSFLLAEGRQITSSQELGDRLGISSAQIRKDLSHFGEFGKQGTGYAISFLYDQLRQILKVDRMWEVALVGAGNLGAAIADYGGFAGKGFVITSIFDTDPEKIGTAIGIDNLVVQDVSELAETLRKRNQGRHHRDACPGCQAVARTMSDAGVKAVLNCADHHPGARQCASQYIDPVVGLQRRPVHTVATEELQSDDGGVGAVSLCSPPGPRGRWVNRPRRVNSYTGRPAACAQVAGCLCAPLPCTPIWHDQHHKHQRVKVLEWQ